MPDLGSRVELEEHETIIDLRDPMVATGLAEALNEVIALSERTGAAETKADLATQERLAAVGKVRRLTDDLEAEQAERHRLEVDNAALRSENLLRSEQLQERRSVPALWRSPMPIRGSQPPVHGGRS